MTRVVLSISLLLLAARGGFAQDDVDRPENERRAIAAIEEVRGWVDYDYDKPGRPVKRVDFFEPTDDHLELLKPFPNLQGIIIRGGTLSETGFARIAQFSQLDHLSIIGVIITDAGLAHIASLSKLKELWLDESTVADAGLAHLVKLPLLTRLSLRRSSISDVGLVHIGQMTHLRDVDLSGTRVTDDGVARLKEALPYALIVSRRDSGRSELDTFFSFVALAAGIAFVGLLAVLGLRRFPFVRRREWMLKWVVVVFAIAIFGTGLLCLDPVMSPIRDGDAGTFWVHVCQIDVGAKNSRRSIGSFYLPRDGWFIYYDQGFHGQDLRRVPASDAIALFPKLVEKLRSAPPGLLHPDVETGFQKWLATSGNPSDAAGFLARVHEARLNRARAQNQQSYVRALSREEDFDERWERVRRYHWNVRFEFAFFTALILFAAWPWLRGAGRTRCAIHLGLVPTLYCLPFWLGYAQFTLTSAGPSGGVLYPFLLYLLHGLPWSDLDTMILRNLPQPLSQTPGPMMSISGRGGVGPVATMALGLVVFAALNWGPVLFRYLKTRRSNPSGDPVSIDGDSPKSEPTPAKE